MEEGKEEKKTVYILASVLKEEKRTHSRSGKDVSIGSAPTCKDQLRSGLGSRPAPLRAW